MAEAHAKLSLCSNKVTVFDAVAAIKLYEENMVAQCGYSCIIKQQHQEQDGHQNVRI
jgi:DNA replicative helicase MCM subunit Mcm2 (Cdc46/Mcm family)